jgi:hypothetical protein
MCTRAKKTVILNIFDHISSKEQKIFLILKKNYKRLIKAKFDHTNFDIFNFYLIYFKHIQIYALYIS